MDNEIFIFLLLQMLTYGLVDSINMKKGRTITFVIYISICLFILPNFYPVPESNIFCFSNPFATFESRWLIRLMVVVFAHLLYCFFLEKKEKIKLES
jgi:hypothetical protein